MKINHMTNYQELLKLANHYLIAHPPRHLSEATHAQYEKEFLNIIKNCESINSAISKICNTNKKSTFFKRKYAIQSILSDQIQDCLVEIQTAIYPSKEEIEKLLPSRPKIVTFYSRTECRCGAGSGQSAREAAVAGLGRGAV